MSANVINEIEKLRNSGQTWEDIGDLIGVSGALIWKIAHGHCESNQVTRYFYPLPKVDRMAARLTVEEGRQCRTKLRSIGYASITDFWRDVANGVLDLRWFE